MAAIALCGCASAPARRTIVLDSGKGLLGGTVLDASTHLPVAGARIIAVRAWPRRAWAAGTDRNGVFSIPQLPPGSFDVQIEREEYATGVARTVEVEPDRATSLEVDLGRGSGEHLDLTDLIIPPVYVSGPDPQYTAPALRLRAQGTVVAKCVITRQGTVTECKVVASVPEMNKAVVDALQRRIYRPATRNGIPIEVNYSFYVELHP